MKKALVIVNPKAGKMSIHTGMFDIINLLCENDILPTVYFTKAAGDATEITKKALKKEEYDLFVCCGGDGTLNEVVSGVICSGKNIPIGYIPAGSTNDFAQSLKIPTELFSAAQSVALAEKALQIDAGLFCEDRVFSYIASFGAFTATSYSVPQNIKNTLGHFAYILAGIKDLAQIKPYFITLSSEEKECSGNYIFGACSNSFSLGGIIRLSSKMVNLNDGKFEVLLVKQPQNAIQMNKILWGLINTDFSDTEVFEFFKTSKVSLSMPKAVNWSLDGEFAKGQEKVEIKAIPHAINLWNKINF